MAGGNFLHRVISYFVNEVVVNGLANSQAFQRFAVKTSKRIDEVSKMAAQKRREIVEKVKDVTEEIESRRNH